MNNLIRNICLTLFMACSVSMMADDGAIEAFLQGHYEEAYQIFRETTAETDMTGRTNFYYGAAMAMTNHDLDEAVRRLNLAQTKNFLKTDTYLYLGRAYQLMCDFETAHTNLDKFIKSSKDNALLALAETFDADCQSAMQIASKIFTVKTVSKQQTTEKDMLGAYHASREAGRVCRNSHFFEADIDMNGIMYITEREDAVFFSLPDEDSLSHIMKMEKLIGGWTEMVELDGITGDCNDMMPVLMTDGTTLYFTSDRPGGMGGLDIYRSTYDSESRTFSEPVNMGVPFNSPYDDYLFVADEEKQRAWFASNRETHNADSLTVYEIIWDNTVIRSMAETTQQIRDAIAMPLTEATTTKTTTKTTITAVPEAFRLEICDTLTYTQWEHFRNPNAQRTYRQVLKATAERDALAMRIAQQRKDFMNQTTDEEKNATLQELLRTERNIYQLDDEITEKTESLRAEEIQTVNLLIARNAYTSINSIALRPAAIDYQAWLKPENFTVFSSVFFAETKANIDEDVLELMSNDARRAVLHQDSLLAWARIIEMEAQAIEEKARQGATQEITIQDGGRLTFTPEQASAKAREFRGYAGQLTALALDERGALLEALYEQVLSTLADYDTQELTELHNKATQCFASVKEIDAQTATPDKMNKLLTMKRRGIAQLDKTLQRYAVHESGSYLLPQKRY